MKTRMCKYFVAGKCVVGDACRFAHRPEELYEALSFQRKSTSQVATDNAAPAKHNPTLWEQRRDAFAAADRDMRSSNASQTAPASFNTSSEVATILLEAKLVDLDVATQAGQYRKPKPRDAKNIPVVREDVAQTSFDMNMPAFVMSLVTQGARSPQASTAAPACTLVTLSAKEPLAQDVDDPGFASLDAQDSSARHTDDRGPLSQHDLPAVDAVTRVLSDKERRVQPSAFLREDAESLDFVTQIAWAVVPSPATCDDHSGVVKVFTDLDIDSILTNVGDLPAYSQPPSSPSLKVASDPNIKKTSRPVMVDIEDISISELPCNTCPSQKGCHQHLNVTKTAAKSCGLAKLRLRENMNQSSDSGCAICPKGHPGRSCETCYACDCGLRVVTRNTFLDIKEDVEGEEQRSKRTRSQSM